jgi:hypothetical protein
MLITDGTAGGTAALAADTFAAPGRLPGVTGPRAAAAGFVEARTVCDCFANLRLPV